MSLATELLPYRIDHGSITDRSALSLQAFTDLRRSVTGSTGTCFFDSKFLCLQLLFKDLEADGVCFLRISKINNTSLYEVAKFATLNSDLKLRVVGQQILCQFILDPMSAWMVT